MPESALSSSPGKKSGRGHSGGGPSGRGRSGRGHSGRGHYARSEETRARILDATLAEAGRAGFHSTSVARIAARADVAIGILNYHFGSKGELLRELMASQAGEFLALLKPPAAEDDFFSYERTLLLVYLKFLGANPSYVRLAEEVRSHYPQLYREGITAHAAHIIDRIRKGIARGDLKPLSPVEQRTQAYFMLGTLTFLDRYQEDVDYPGDGPVVDAYIHNLRATLAP